MTIGFVRLSAVDLTNLAIEAPDTPMHVGIVAVLDGASICDADGQLRLAEIRADLDQRLSSVPELRRIVHHPGWLAGPPLWVDDPSFDINRHVNGIALSPPGDEAALMRVAEELLAPLLDRAHPMWRIWLVTGLPDGRVAAILALHHAIADGLAAVRLLTALLAPTAAAPHSAWSAADAPGWRMLARDNLRLRLSTLRRLVHRPRTRRLAGTLAISRQLLGHAWHAPRTSLTGPVGPHRALAVFRLDLATVKDVAHAHDGKVNDVVLNLAAGGLRALLRSRGERVDGIDINATVAASPRIRTPAPRTGNRAGIIVVKLPLGEPDPAVRLRLVSANSSTAKREQMLTTEQCLLLWLARLGLLRRFTRRQRLTTVVESNVTGPPAPIRLLGADVIDMIPIGALAGNLAISFLAFSYAGVLTITVRVDADRHPDVPVLVAAMADDWRSLVAIAETDQLMRQADASTGTRTSSGPGPVGVGSATDAGR
ncbi:wax ester/triacylglycerol synthase domain-containing protein [Micromonospora sp. 050-3]|uniref:wax ester/triacylglycerol synthase domain-containing protein n=1 Tax=Micromonospora sp. 050-3 TaxID=2789265 RepID=UPI003979251B